jgi:hypothetical protein
MFFYETKEQWASQSFKDVCGNYYTILAIRRSNSLLTRQLIRNHLCTDFLVKLVSRLLVHLRGNPIPRGETEVQINTRIVVEAGEDKGANNIMW